MFARFDRSSGHHVSWVSHMDHCARLLVHSGRNVLRSTTRWGGTLPDVLEQNREQADLPAEQPAPSQGARLPTADAHPRWPFDRRGPAPQGPPRSDRLRR